MIEPPSDEELTTCPFCEGREEWTPPETLALSAQERAPDTPGWQVRVVPNLYPALERQEVVVHTPRHARSLVELSQSELSQVVAAWGARAETARQEGFSYLQVLVNEGRAAGASLAHSHSQIGWFRDLAPTPADEWTRKGDCGVCELVGSRRKLQVAAALHEDVGEIAAFCHRAGRAPYELIVAPIDHDPEPWGSRLELAIELLSLSLRKLRAVEGPVPVNAWLHCAPFGGDGHWHFELVPRLTVFAGLELGAGLWVNTLEPEQAAERLGEALT